MITIFIYKYVKSILGCLDMKRIYLLSNVYKIDN